MSLICPNSVLTATSFFSDTEQYFTTIDPRCCDQNDPYGAVPHKILLSMINIEKYYFGWGMHEGDQSLFAPSPFSKEGRELSTLYKSLNASQDDYSCDTVPIQYHAYILT